MLSASRLAEHLKGVGIFGTWSLYSFREIVLLPALIGPQEENESNPITRFARWPLVDSVETNSLVQRVWCDSHEGTPCSVQVSRT